MHLENANIIAKSLISEGKWIGQSKQIIKTDNLYINSLSSGSNDYNYLFTFLLNKYQ
jgi:hypothetical protein